MSSTPSEPEPPVWGTLQRVLLGLIQVMVHLLGFSILLAWTQYPENYEFFDEFISALGGRRSELGFDNTTSSIIMIVGFSLVAAVSLALGIVYFTKKQLDHYIYKGIFGIFLGIGAAGIAIPRDLPGWNLVHSIGAFIFMLAFALFNLGAQLLRFKRNHWKKPSKPFNFYSDVIITILVFVVLLLFLLFYLLELVAAGLVPDNLAEIGQKMVLIVDCLAVVSLDTNDI